MTEKSEKQESKFNRSKFKDSTTSAELKASDKSVEDTVKSSGSGNYTKFLDIETGYNKFLLYPSHETIQQMLPENEGKDIPSKPFIQAKSVCWVSKEVEDKDEQGNVKKDKKGNPLMIMKRTPIFDARIHSKTGKDIVDLYITTLKKLLEEEFGTDKAAQDKIKEKMVHIYGRWSDNASMRISGIVSKPTWVVYAKKVIGSTKIFGRLEIGKAIKMRLNELIAIEEARNPIGSDSNNPFIQIDQRRALEINYNKDANDPKLIYTTEMDSSYDRDSGKLNFYPLTDKEMDEFLKYPSLSSLYEDSYHKGMFDTALEGLRILDDQQEYGVFANEDFVDEASMMRDLYPDVLVEDHTDAPVNAIEEDDGKNQFEKMDRDELKKFSRDNKTGIAIHSKLTDDELRNLLRNWEAGQNEAEPEVVEETKQEVVNQAETEQREKNVLKGNAKDRIAAAKAKTQK